MRALEKLKDGVRSLRQSERMRGEEQRTSHAMGRRERKAS